MLSSKGAGGGCNERVPERTYTDNQLVYRLAVDLTQCDWWDGSLTQLEADLERLEGSGGHGAWSGTLCGAVSAIRPDNGEVVDGNHRRPVRRAVRLSSAAPMGVEAPAR